MAPSQFSTLNNKYEIAGPTSVRSVKLYSFSFSYFCVTFSKYNFFSIEVKFLVFYFLAMSEFSIFSEDSNSPDIMEEKEDARNFISKLFDTKKYSDVTFVVNGFEYRAHRNILSRFDYFDSMFSPSFQEGKENKISINNIAPEIFNIMLEFIYRNRLSNWKEIMQAHSEKLLKAANLVCSRICPKAIGYFIEIIINCPKICNKFFVLKYGIVGLRKNCEKYIIRAGKITVETACEYFIMADEHNAPQLLEAATKFISM